MTKRTMWAVGPDGDDPWFAINAKTGRGAVTAYLNEHGGQRKYIEAIRVPEWDCLEKVTRVDWFWVGRGLLAYCDSCECGTSQMEDGVIIDGRVFCEFCKPTLTSPKETDNG